MKKENMESYGTALQTKADRPMTHIELFINESREYNSDLMNIVSRLDSLCSKLRRSKYEKNQITKDSIGAVPTPKESDGLMEDLNEIQRQKSYLVGELLMAVDYLEQHI